MIIPLCLYLPAGPIIVSVIFFPVSVSFTRLLKQETQCDCKVANVLPDKLRHHLQQVKSRHTWQSAIVSDEAGHVNVLIVDTQALHAAHKLAVSNGKVLREFRDASEEQWASQV